MSVADRPQPGPDAVEPDPDLTAEVPSSPDAEPEQYAVPTERVLAQSPSTPPRRRRLVGRLAGGLRRAVEPIRRRPAPVAVERTVPVPPPPEPPGQRLLNQSPFTIGFFGCLGVLLAYGLMNAAVQASSILLVILVSFFLALGLNPFVEFLTVRKWPRGLAVLMVFIGLVGIIAAAASVAVPVFSEQINSLLNSYPDWLRSLRDNQTFARWDAEYGIIERLTQFLTSGSLLNQAFGGILGAGKLVVSVLSSVVVGLVLTLYFLVTLPQIKEVIYRLAPASRRPRARYLADESFKRVGGYLTGMFGVVTCAGICAFLMMMVIGLSHYALALAVVVALFSFVPLIGATMSMILVGLVGFSSSPWQGIVAVVYFLLYQQVEAYLVQPRLMRHSVQVPPTVTIIAILLGGTLLGLVGAIIAIPLAATVLLFYREVLVPRLDQS
ncbi:MAG: AI-2E family transporter [Propionibacterium sp.]|nr:AI-2E family transporter [Propionibacterium sp.]